MCVCVCVCVHALSCFSPVQLGGTLWMVALQNPLSMGFSTKEYWSELPCSSRGDIPDPGIEPTSLTSPALAVGSLQLASPGKLHAAAAAKSLQSCPSLCDPRDGSPPSSPVPGILQARILEWVAISFSNA